MEDKLRRRLPDASDEEIFCLASILSTYSISPTIKNLDSTGFLFTDARGRTARVCVGDWRQTEIYIKDPKAEIAIICVDSIILGWIESNKLEDLEDRFVVAKNVLSPMPDTFSFDQKCSHLEDWGGIHNGKNWLCLGCNGELVFNDK